MGWYGKLVTDLGRRQWFSNFSADVLTPIDRFVRRATGGRLAVTKGALPSLLLTTIGRKSGQERSTPVLYLDHGDDYIVVASNWGKEKHPAWSANLLANPDATVQVGRRRERVRARQATEAEKADLWPRLLEIYPTWTAYTERTDRDFRAFFLEKVS